MKASYGRVAEGQTIAEIYKTISPKNKSFIDEFREWKKGSVSDKRLLLICNSLIKFADLVEKDFDKLTKREMTIAWNKIASSDLKTKSKQDEFIHIKQCFKHWFGDDEDYPPVVKGMKRPKQKQRLSIPKTLPTEEQLHDAIKKCGNFRDKFWIAWTGLDSGVRPCENRALTWGDLKKDEYGYFFIVKTAKDSGDSDTRHIRVINSEPYLFEWMKNYPSKKDDKNFIFCRLDDGSIPMDRDAVTSMFKRLKKKIKFRGKFSPYVLRHALITQMSKNPKVSIPLLKKMIGHSKNSSIISEYQHFGDEDVLNMQLSVSGQTETKGKNFELKNKPIKCPHCKTSNPFDAEICGKCSFALSQNRRTDREELNKEMDLINKNYQEIAKELSILREALQDNREEVKFFEKKEWERKKELSPFFNLLNTDIQSAS
ncbi:MAG: site-specific integrase [archaeon]